MARKSNPLALRLALPQQRLSDWYLDHRTYARGFQQDLLIRQYLEGVLGQSTCVVGEIAITRTYRCIDVRVTWEHLFELNEGRTGAVPANTIAWDTFAESLSRLTSSEIRLHSVQITGTEYRSAQLIARSLAKLLEKRVAAKVVITTGVKRARQVDGLKIELSGRFQGVTMARKETMRLGQVPLQTLRARVDYALAIAYTTYGTFGVKVWLLRKSQITSEGV